MGTMAALQNMVWGLICGISVLRKLTLIELNPLTSRPQQCQQDYLASFSRLDHRFLPSADPHLHTRCNLILCLTSHLFPSGVSHQFPSISSTFPSQYYCYPRRMPDASIIWKRKNWTNQKPKPKQQNENLYSREKRLFFLTFITTVSLIIKFFIP